MRQINHIWYMQQLTTRIAILQGKCIVRIIFQRDSPSFERSSRSWPSFSARRNLHDCFLAYDLQQSRWDPCFLFWSHIDMIVVASTIVVVVVVVVVVVASLLRLEIRTRHSSEGSCVFLFSQNCSSRHLKMWASSVFRCHELVQMGGFLLDVI